VIVVDNGSTDDTQIICAEFQQLIPNMRCLFEKKTGLYVGLHAGLKASQGEVLVYRDDEIRAFPTWLEGVAEGFNDSEVGLLGGKVLPDLKGLPPTWVHNLWQKAPWGNVLPYYCILDFGDDIQIIDPLYIWGCNFCIRQSLLEAIGGFHPYGMPQELIRYRGDGETAVSIEVKKVAIKLLIIPARRSTISFPKKGCPMTTCVTGLMPKISPTRAPAVRPAVYRQLDRSMRALQGSRCGLKQGGMHGYMEIGARA
jgi:glycosyltransferase involved in cell wall biosynthesis